MVPNLYRLFLGVEDIDSSNGANVDINTEVNRQGQPLHMAASWDTG